MKAQGFDKSTINFINLIKTKKRPCGSPYMYGANKTEKQIQIIAKQFINDIKHYPELYIPLPTAKTIDFSRYFENKNGTNINMLNSEDLLDAITTATNYQLRLWFARINGTLEQLKEEIALSTAKKRIKCVRNLAKYLGKQQMFKAVESAHILAASIKYVVRSKGNGDIQVSKIKNTNTHNIMLIRERLANKIQQNLKCGLGTKSAFIEASTEYIQELHIEGKVLNLDGWKEFPKSSCIKDAEKLAKACINTDWCIGGDTDTAQGYLCNGSFWLYYDQKNPQIAVYSEYHNQEGEVFGCSDDQEVADEYIEIVESFLFRNEVDDFFDSETICNILESINAGKINKHLLKYFKLDLDLNIIIFDKEQLAPSIKSFINNEIVSKLNSMISMGDIVETHSNGTITIHSSLKINKPCKQLDLIVSNVYDLEKCIAEIKGNLNIFHSDGLHFTNLTRIFGYLDARNTRDLSMPKLQLVNGCLDISGSIDIYLTAIVRGEIIGLDDIQSLEMISNQDYTELYSTDLPNLI